MRHRRLAVAAATGALALTALGAPAFADGPTDPPPADGQAFGQQQAQEGQANRGRGFFRVILR